MVELLVNFAVAAAPEVFLLLVLIWMKREGRRLPTMDGDVLVLKRGPGTTVFLMFMLAISAVALSAIIWMELNREFGEPSVGMILCALFVLLLLTGVVIGYHKHRVFVETDGIVVEGAITCRRYPYADIREIDETESAIALRLVNGEKVEVSKELAGWKHGLAAMRRRLEESRVKRH